MGTAQNIALLLTVFTFFTFFVEETADGRINYHKTEKPRNNVHHLRRKA